MQRLVTIGQQLGEGADRNEANKCRGVHIEHNQRCRTEDRAQFETQIQRQFGEELAVFFSQQFFCSGGQFRDGAQGILSARQHGLGAGLDQFCQETREHLRSFGQ